MRRSLFIVLSLLMIIQLPFINGCKKAEKQPQGSNPNVAQSSPEDIGEKLFNKHCVMCHPDDKRMKNIKTIKDVMKAMRNPKPGMPRFNEKEIPDDAAGAIAQYIFFSLILSNK